MRLMESGRDHAVHQLYLDDKTRELEGLHDELIPREHAYQPLHERLQTVNERREEGFLQMILRAN